MRLRGVAVVAVTGVVLVAGCGSGEQEDCRDNQHHPDDDANEAHRETNASSPLEDIDRGRARMGRHSPGSDDSNAT